MLEKSSKTPRGRLLNLFDILEDWLDAPSIAEQIHGQEQLELRKQLYLPTQLADKTLQKYLAQEAAKAGAAMPEMLASQLYFMALAAAQERLNGNHKNSLNHAKAAASALISAQTQKEFHIAKPTAYAIAASFIAVFAIAGSLFMLNLKQQASPTQITAKQIPIQAAIPTLVAESVVNAQQTAALMAQIEQMRHGNCQLIEAIQLPDSQKGIYINMVVNGQVSSDPKEQAIALDLLQRTRCNYTPMLMANSTG